MAVGEREGKKDFPCSYSKTLDRVKTGLEYKKLHQNNHIGMWRAGTQDVVDLCRASYNL